MLFRLWKRAPALGVAISVSLAVSCGGSNGPTGPTGGTVTVIAIAPSTGSTFGGTTVTITGTGFASGATVQIGGTAATDVAVVNSTTITAKSPAHAAGTGDVQVSAGGATGSMAGAFTFVPPVTGPNAAPTVGAISVTPPRDNQPDTLATIGDRITLTATINDAESALSDLTIEWSALPDIGTFTGSGASVQWVAPESTTSPQTVVLMLTVLEHYFEADSDGLPVQRENRVQRTTSVRVHDTVKEVSDMAVDFLERFSDSSITNPEIVLHNFSQTCDGGDGYDLEYDEIVFNRDTYVIESFDISEPSKFEWEFGGDRICSGTNKSTTGDVCVSVPVTWIDRLIGDSDTRTVRGTDFVSARYEDTRWRLCHSRFEGIDTLTGHAVQMDFDRKRIIKGPRQK